MEFWEPVNSHPIIAKGCVVPNWEALMFLKQGWEVCDSTFRFCYVFSDAAVLPQGAILGYNTIFIKVEIKPIR